MATKGKTKRSSTKAGKRRAAPDAEVYPFRLLVPDEGVLDRSVDPDTCDRAKDVAIRVCWKAFTQMSTERLADLLPVIVRFGAESDKAHEHEFDTGELVRA